GASVPAPNMDNADAPNTNVASPAHPVKGVAYLYIWTFEDNKRVKRVLVFASVMVFVIALAAVAVYFLFTKIPTLLMVVVMARACGYLIRAFRRKRPRRKQV